MSQAESGIEARSGSRTRNDVSPVVVSSWADLPWLRHGFSTRAGGVSTVYGTSALNLGFTKEDDAGVVRENRRLLVEAVAAGAALVVPKQVHSVTIRTIRSTEDEPGEADALLTDVPGVLIGVGTADCVPVLLVDTKRRAVAAIHAGWRGTVAGITELAVAKMEAAFGSEPRDLRAAIGPSIGACCYAVGEEVRGEFAARFGYAGGLFRESLVAGTPYLDLWEANRRQLLDAGVGKDRIVVTGLCTACARDAEGRRRFFSHRDEQGRTGRQLNVIGVAGSETAG